MKEKEILQNVYERSMHLDIKNIALAVKKDIDILIDNIESNKSLILALTTSLLKKIISPQQDIRLPRIDFANGYSARVLDTRITTPFFKNYFPKYANKESAFLTLSTREKIKWTKDEGQNLKIRNSELKEAFLNIFDQIEVFKQKPEIYLEYLFFSLIKLSKTNESLYQKTEHSKIDCFNNININVVLSMLSKHFQIKNSSRLPVIAVYSMYEALFDKFDRYRDKQLIPLQPHTSSDKHTFGDIEIYTRDGKPFEIVEIKHNVPIDEYLIFDVIKKISKTEIDRYYILTTFENSFKNSAEEKKVLDTVLNIKKENGIDIIANGILTTIKYYLRFIDNYECFLKIYTDNLIKDAKMSTEIKSFHIEEWNKIQKDI
ncbi:MAG: DNA methyltransferase [Elusimicrobiota bacterium]|jgi:DNA (cytosine-5)-methyltransferase 1|nr:DNA methyltransferase [Elusimicrobiota bacterium]